MGVTNRSRITYKASVASSTAASSSESLHLAADGGGSETGEPAAAASTATPAVAFRAALGIISCTNGSRSSAPGRRRAHRLKSTRDLENLATITEEAEDDNVIACHAPRNSPFFRILNNSRLASVWDAFCQYSEAEQKAVLEPRERTRVSAPDKDPTRCAPVAGLTSRSALLAYKSLTYLTRRRLRKIKNLTQLCSTEKNIVEHFYERNEHVLDKCNLDERILFLCHAIAQYYNLKCKLVTPAEGATVFRMHNMAQAYIHCAESLSSFLRTRHT